MIHKTAIIDDSAIIPQTCDIGANVVIGKDVKLGDNVKIMPNAYLEYCEIGDNTTIAPFASIGTTPQDLGYKNEPTKAIIGKNCTIKEYVTVNRASGEGNSTNVGDKCLLMTSSHVAHNCKVADEVILANLATLGGHIQVGKGAFLGGMSVFHQNIRIGEMCIVSGFSAARMDIPPFCKADGRPPYVRGINAIGLKRRNISIEHRNNLKNALKVFQLGQHTTTEALKIVKKSLVVDEYVQILLDFIENSKRGVFLKCKSVSNTVDLED